MPKERDLMAEGQGAKEPGVEIGGGVLLNQEPEKGRPRNLRSGRQVVLLWEPPWQGVPCQTRGGNILSLDRIYNSNGNKRLVLDFYWVRISGDWIVFKGDLGRFYFCQRGNREFCCPTPATVTAINGFLQLHHDAPNLSLQNNGGGAFGWSWWDLGLIFCVHHHTGTCWLLSWWRRKIHRCHIIIDEGKSDEWERDGFEKGQWGNQLSDEEILGSKEENWVDDGTHGAQLGSKYATTPQATSPLHGVQVSLAIPTPLCQLGNLAITTSLSSPSSSWAGCRCGEQLGQSGDASGQYFQPFAGSVYLSAVLNTLSHQLLCSQYLQLCSTNLTKSVISCCRWPCSRTWRSPSPSTTSTRPASTTSIASFMLGLPSSMRWKQYSLHQKIQLLDVKNFT